MKDCILTSTDPQLWKDMMDEGTGILWTQQALTGLLQAQVFSTRSVTFSQLSEATILLMISFKRRLSPGGRIMMEDENSAGKQEHSTSSNQTLGSGWLLPLQGHCRHFFMSGLLGPEQVLVKSKAVLERSRAEHCREKQSRRYFRNHAFHSLPCAEWETEVPGCSEIHSWIMQSN